MASVVITFRIMPNSPEVKFDHIEKEATKLIAAFGGTVGKKEFQPVAFGLKALMLYFVMDEKIGSTEKLEQQVSEIDGVESVEVSDVRRAIG